MLFLLSTGSVHCSDHGGGASGADHITFTANREILFFFSSWAIKWEAGLGWIGTDALNPMISIRQQKLTRANNGNKIVSVLR